MKTQCSLLTVGDIAAELDVAIHRIRYAIATHHIRPKQRAGIIRLFDESAVEALRELLSEKDAGTRACK